MGIEVGHSVLLVPVIHFEVFPLEDGLNNGLVDELDWLQSVFSGARSHFSIFVFVDGIENLLEFWNLGHIQNLLDLIDSGLDDGLDEFLVIDHDVLGNSGLGVLDRKSFGLDFYVLLLSLENGNEFLDCLIDLRLDDNSLSDGLNHFLLDHLGLCDDSFSNDLWSGRVPLSDDLRGNIQDFGKDLIIDFDVSEGKFAGSRGGGLLRLLGHQERGAES